MSNKEPMMWKVPGTIATNNEPIMRKVPGTNATNREPIRKGPVSNATSRTNHYYIHCSI